MTDFAALEKVADAIIYEGYLLYPYRPSALKNRLRWTFGCLAPACWAESLGEPSWLQAECLVRGAASRVAVRCRFLRLADSGPVVAQVETPTASLGELSAQPVRVGDGSKAEAEVSACAIGEGVYRLRVRLDNTASPPGPCPATRDDALAWGLLSCHVVLGVEGGVFLSAIDPPAECRALAAACRNVGVWPVLAGDPAAPQLMLAAPIILTDHPRVAPESRIDLFDGTEIDELLRLRVLTLTDEEKEEVKRGDERGRRLLEGVAGMSEADALALHGAWRRGPRAGDRVRLRPGRRADLFDMALAGRAATVVSVDEDLEGRRHVGVVLDDDPGRDLGLAGWPGHRFFFAPEEVEPL